MRYTGFIILLVIVLTSCDRDDNGGIEGMLYEGCCATMPVETTVGVDLVYVPSAFSSNADGINDYFVVHSTSILLLRNLEIKDRDGALLFERDSLVPASGYIVWDGMGPSGETYRGLFEYELTVHNAAGNMSFISGQACNIICEDAAVLPEDLDRCAWPIQNGDGNWDTTIDPSEFDCF